MQIKVIQVNIYKGRYQEMLIEFLKIQNPDIIFMQEVTCGVINLNGDDSNIFESLKRSLGYDGVFFASATILDRPNSFQGNAILTRHKIIASKFTPLNRHAGMNFATFNNVDFFPDFPRSIVEASIEVNNREIAALSCHGAWTAPPTDNVENFRQAKLIAKYLKALDLPYVMGADMNMPPATRVIKTIEKCANNLTRDSGIVQTTHPTVHKIAPRGYLVDYIFTSGDFKRVSIEAPNILVSDHLPLVAVLELGD